MSHEIRKYQWADTDQGGGATGDFVTTDGTTEQDAVLLTERADHVNTPAPGKAELWVTSDTTQKLILTDDSDTDCLIPNFEDTTPSAYSIPYMDPAGGPNGKMVTAAAIGIWPYGANPYFYFNGASAIRLGESASNINPGVGKGAYWIKNDAPNVPMFTDDADVDHQLAYDPGVPKSATLTRDGNGAVETVTVTGGATWTISRNPNQSVASLTDTVYLVTVDRDGGGIITGVTATVV